MAKDILFIQIGGTVAAGKSTIAHIIRNALIAEGLDVDLISTEEPVHHMLKLATDQEKALTNRLDTVKKRNPKIIIDTVYSRRDLTVSDIITDKHVVLKGR